MLAKAVRIYRSEGLDGFSRRFQSRLKLGSTIKSRYGIRLACNYGDATFQMYVNGSYGTYLWDHISQVSAPFVFLDIGANQGLYTLCAARNPMSARCHAFEPVAKTFALLRKNIEINDLQQKCSLHNVAVSDETGTAELSMSSAHSGGATIETSRTNARNFDLKIHIDTINHHRLDEIIGQDDLPIIVKIDVEGFEHTVLKELMASRHAGRIQEIFYEVDERWLDAPQLIQLLKTAGFQTFQQIGSGSHYDVLATR